MRVTNGLKDPWRDPSGTGAKQSDEKKQNRITRIENFARNNSY